jgi:integrase
LDKLGFNSEEVLKQHSDVNVNIHAFRKTFASRLVMNGVSIDVASRILAHADI